MDKLKQVGFTAKDFDLLIEGLETLPEKGIAGEMMGMMLEGMLSKGDPEVQEKQKLDREKKAKQKEYEKQLMKEDIRILQSKLYQLRRYMQENHLIETAENIINKQL